MENNTNLTNGIRKRVLIVEDEFINREILGAIVGSEYDVVYAENGREALDVLEREENISLILLDLMMPVLDGFAFLKIREEREELKQTPVIVLTAEKQKELESIKAGAVDFIPKPYDEPEIILARCARIIELSDNRHLIQAVERDQLTDLYTKEFFYRYIEDAEKYGNERAMDAVMLNIDHFHLVNELFGRAYGDEVLRAVGTLIGNRLFDTEGYGCRAEGDSFYVYCPHRDDYEETQRWISGAFDEQTKSSRIRIRLGVYQNVDKSLEIESWFDRAKLACNLIRGDYMRQVSYYNSELHEKAIYQERLINDLQEAIEKKHLIVYYQPKYGIQGEEMTLRSAEALIRWRHPEFGMISPGDFIPLFEKNGLIQKLDNFVWSEAASQMRRWKDQYGITIPVSVNVSRIDIYDPELLDKLLGNLEKNRLTPDEYILEITESAYSDNASGLLNVVELLRDKGFRIAMDDFGSGYSSLNMLTNIPIDVLKLDMKFVRNMEKDEKSMRLVELIMDIASFLGVPVVAEGVENEEQLRILRKIGCDVVQGFYFSRPVPPEEFSCFIEKECERISRK